MTETPCTRRAVLVGSAAALTSLAGCTRQDVPVLGDDRSELQFDPEPLRQVVEDTRLGRPRTYSGPVPDRLATHHEQRARELLEGVPENPSIPNGAVADRLTRERERVAEQLAEDPEESLPLERLGAWRYRRASAAEVRGAYRAATDEFDTAPFYERRDAIRRDVAAFWEPWSYRSRDVVEAVVIYHHLEELSEACYRYLDPNRPLPETPNAAVFRVGDEFADLERTRGTYEDLTGLWQSYRDSTGTLTAYRDALSIAAERLQRTADITRHQVSPYIRDGAGPDDFERDIEDLPAEDLFFDAQRGAINHLEESDRALQRRHYAGAVAASGRALVGLLTLSRVVDVIRAGRHGIPKSLEAVREIRSKAQTAVEQTETISPAPLGVILGTPAWNALGYAESVIRPDYLERRDGPESLDRGDVTRAVASYALALHAASVVPTVTERVVAELLAASG